MSETESLLLHWFPTTQNAVISVLPCQSGGAPPEIQGISGERPGNPGTGGAPPEIQGTIVLAVRALYVGEPIIESLYTLQTQCPTEN